MDSRTLVECLLSVTSPHKNDIGNTLALSLGVVGERAGLDGSAGLVEEFLRSKDESDEWILTIQVGQTHPNSGFIYIHRQVADNDLERVLGGLVEGCDGSLLLSATGCRHSTGVSSTRTTRGRSRCSSTSSSTGTAAPLGVLVGCLSAGDELVREKRRKRGEGGKGCASDRSVS